MLIRFCQQSARQFVQVFRLFLLGWHEVCCLTLLYTWYSNFHYFLELTDIVNVASTSCGPAPS